MKKFLFLLAVVALFANYVFADDDVDEEEVIIKPTVQLLSRN